MIGNELVQMALKRLFLEETDEEEAADVFLILKLEIQIVIVYAENDKMNEKCCSRMVKRYN